MSDIAEDRIVAYVDNELDAEGRAGVDAAAATDPAVAERIAMHRALRRDLSGLFAGVVDEAVPDTLAAIVKPAGMPSADILPFQLKPARGWWLQAGAMAACLVAGIALTLAVAGGDKGDIATRHGVMMAQGKLAKALSGQLAADTAGPVRIALTFRDRSGAVCRTFWTSAVDGLACREGAGWRIDATARHEDQGTYRQASSSLVTAAAQDRAEGDVFDAAEEAKARAAGWRAIPPTP